MRKKTFKFNNKKFRLQPIDSKHMKNVLELFSSCSDFFQTIEGRDALVSDVRALYLDFLPLSKQSDKHLLGLFENKKLLGVVELTINYPKENSCFLSLILLHNSIRNLGLGTAIHNHLNNCFNDFTFTAAVSSNNPLALNFFQKLNYNTTSTSKPLSRGNKISSLNFLTQERE